MLLQAKSGAYAYFAVKIEEYEDSLDYYATSFISSSLEKLVKLGITQANLAKFNHNDINLLIEKERLEQSVAVKENSNIKMKI